MEGSQIGRIDSFLGRSLPRELGRLYRFGLILAALWVATLLGWALVQPDPYAQGWRLVLELAFLGRLVSVADGIASGFSNEYLLIQNVFQDALLLVLVYPWIVHGWESHFSGTFFGRRLRVLRRSAERSRRLLEPFGALGLWAFVFFPFWSTGVLVGALVGYMMGLRAWVVLTSCLVGHVLSVVLIIWYFDGMEAWLRGVDESLIRFLPWMAVGVWLLVGLTGRVVRRFGRS